ncbi:MAG: DsbE family thiol:disulfide interchange protein [Hyphomicrobiaceae bacterium]|nr:DsbE family thiol:disulfide interchange protein [Hyphomicrobiaceae bacterium]
MSAEQDRANRSSTHAASPAEGRQRSGFVVLPVAIFFGLAIMFAFALFSGDPSKLPSALIGRPAPQVDFAPLEGLKHAEQQVPGFTAKELAEGNVHVVNFWASWCIPCVQEHPYLVELQKRTGVAIMGVNYKDGADDGRRFIGRYGNPFKAVGVDPLGRGAIEWGVYGMPETFIVDGSGRIAFKQVGPITNEAALEKMIAEIEKARAKTAAKPQS